MSFRFLRWGLTALSPRRRRRPLELPTPDRASTPPAVPRVAYTVAPPLLHSLLAVSQVKHDHPSPIRCSYCGFLCVPLLICAAGWRIHSICTRKARCLLLISIPIYQSITHYYTYQYIYLFSCIVNTCVTLICRAALRFHGSTRYFPTNPHPHLHIVQHISRSMSG